MLAMSLSYSLGMKYCAANCDTESMPWPRDELVIACSIVRLQFAVRRIRKHLDSAWVALDVLRRDRAIRGLLACCDVV